MSGRVLAFAGGVGGAKLAAGLADELAADDLTICVNTGDDFTHLGLHISPDLDTVMYTLAGLNNPETGWGLAGESWAFMDALGRLGGETWFNLGDRDIATHIERTRRLAAGESLSAVTSALCSSLGIAAAIVPMSDEPVRTIVETPDGDLPFQDYFVRLRCEPVVTGFRFEGADAASPSADIERALSDEALSAIVICPSNPFVSTAPIFAVPGIRDALTNRACPMVAVSPIVGGAAIKGPAAKMMRELGADVSALGIARHYRDTIDGLVIDNADAAFSAEIEALGLRVLVTGTVMKTAKDRARLARETLTFATGLGRDT